MSHDPGMPPAEQSSESKRKAQEMRERFELLDHLQRLLEPLMTALGLVFLALLLLDYAGGRLSVGGDDRLDETLQAIWIVFLVDFVVRFAVAPSKGAFLRHNWLTVLSLGLPFLRPLRALRAARALRSLSLVRLLGGLNRGIRVLRLVTRGRQLAYVGVLTVFVVVAGAVGVLSFDRSVPDAPIQTFGDALWWSAAMVTTINNELHAVSPEARVIAVLQRIYAVSIFGYITASIASYLIGSSVLGSGTAGDADRAFATDAPGDLNALHAELAALRHEVMALRQALRDQGNITDDVQGVDGDRSSRKRTCPTG